MPRLLNQLPNIRMGAIVAVLISACSGGGSGSSGNQAPIATGDIVRAAGAELGSIDVLANDSDPEGDTLTVAIEESPNVGTAAVNSDGTVGISELPSGFKGLTQFRYRVSDPEGASAIGTAAIFIGVAPFRVAFAADESGGGFPEVFMTDFVSPPAAITAATEGNFKLRGFVVSDNGATIVYRRQDMTDDAATELAFVRTDDGAQQVPIELPNGSRPVRDAQGNDQYRVSPDGQWVATIARDGTAPVLYVLDVSDPATVTPVSPVGAERVTLPRFSLDSRALYFLASDAATGTGKSLYTVALDNPGTVAQISAPIAAGSSDDVLEYTVAPNQERILLEAQRNGRVGLYFVDPTDLQNEIQVSHTLAVGEKILESTVGLPVGSGGSGERVAYTTQSLTVSSYVAEVSANPNPRGIATSGARIIGFRPDDAALLYTKNGQVFESIVDSAAADHVVGDGGNAWYDSTGNIVLLEQFLSSGGSPPSYPALAVAVRGSFGTTQPLGTSGLAAHFIDTSGMDRGVAIVGEGATTGAAPTSVRLALVNALAPDAPLYLADFESPLQLTSGIAQVVTN